jgi:lipoyl-dependent peroxiredoxin
LGFRVTRRAQASWQGNVEAGGGRLALGSGAFEGAYSLRARVEEGLPATNPEELLAAAEAGCFTMSLANLLGEAGHEARSIQTTARARLQQVGDAFNITLIELNSIAEVPGLEAARFAEIAAAAKDCTVSRALAGTEITLTASLAAGDRPPTAK